MSRPPPSSSSSGMRNLDGWMTGHMTPHSFSSNVFLHYYKFYFLFDFFIFVNVFSFTIILLYFPCFICFHSFFYNFCVFTFFLFMFVSCFYFFNYYFVYLHFFLFLYFFFYFIFQKNLFFLIYFIMKIISKKFCIFSLIRCRFEVWKRRQTSAEHINIWIKCCCRHSSSSSSIIFFFRDEELGWMDDRTDDATDGWKGRPPKDII